MSANSWSGAWSWLAPTQLRAMNGRKPFKGSYIHDIAQDHVVAVDLPFAS